MKIKKTIKDKFIVSTLVGSKGQIVLPKIARDFFDIKPGDTLIIMGDKKRGMAILKEDAFYNIHPINDKEGK